MKLLVPFLIAAVLVAALVVMALRDEPAPAAPQVANRPVVEAKQSVDTPPRPAVTRPDVPVEATGAEQIDTNDMMILLRDYGFGKLEAKWREWAMSRGYPALDGTGASGYLYDQPYEQYDDEVLRGLAGNGDMWAQQILAKRLAKTSPAEAIELYRQAAINGSVYAMSEMANLYGRISDKRREVEFKNNELALEQVYAMRDSPVSPQVAGYAWTAVAELAGTEPMFGNIAASQFNRTLSEEEKAEGCEMARSMYDEISTQRTSMGLGDFNRNPPPIVYWDPQASSSCAEHEAPQLDLSACRHVEMTEEGQTNTIWICAE